MRFSDILIAQIKAHEGYMPMVYVDSTGHTTIGYGHKLSQDEMHIYQKGGINEASALVLLKADLSAIYEELIDKALWISRQSPARRDCLYNMAYNLGVAGLLKFTRMLDYVRDGKYTEATQEMKVSKWSIQVGQRAVDLMKQMITDEYVLEE